MIDPGPIISGCEKTIPEHAPPARAIPSNKAARRCGREPGDPRSQLDSRGTFAGTLHPAPVDDQMLQATFEGKRQFLDLRPIGRMALPGAPRVWGALREPGPAG